jgi:hypothetical protein
MSGDLSERCRAFILDNIGSVVQLEALLLLQRSGTPWSVEAMARELRVEPSGALVELGELLQRGLVQRDGRDFRYAPANEATAACVAELAEAYQDRRVTVITLIYSRPRDPVRVFADAFRIRKEDDDA